MNSDASRTMKKGSHSVGEVEKKYSFKLACATFSAFESFRLTIDYRIWRLFVHFG